MQSYEEDEDVGPQPTIARVKQTWIEEATRVGLIKGPQRNARHVAYHTPS